MPKIKPHVFHEFFSRYDQSLSLKKRWNRNPSHSIRSFFGAKDPYNKNDNVKITEFATEEEALTWYKKSHMKQEDFDKIKSEGFCKNYFTIPEAEFSKYRGIFNQMIKSLKINSEFEINGGGNIFVSCTTSDLEVEIVPSEEQGKKISKTVTVTNPYGSSICQGLFGSDDIGYLDGKQVNDEAGYYEIELTKEKKSSFSGYGKDTVGGNVGASLDITWYKEGDYKTKLKLTNNYDSSKIFEIKDLEDRVDPNNFSYVTYRVNDSSSEEKDEETLTMKGQKIFEKEWKFNKDTFKEIFSDKFNLDRTFKNDPIFLLEPSQTNYEDSYINLNFNNNHYAIRSSCIEDFETVLTKTYKNLGEYKVEIKNTNAYFNTVNQDMNFYISSIIYIKSKKIYLCFIDFTHNIICNYTGLLSNSECPDADCLAPGTAVYINSNLHVVSTNDSVKSYYKDLSYENLCNKDPEDSQKFEFEIKKLDLKILDKTFQVEYQCLKPREFKTDYRNCGDTFKNSIEQYLYATMKVDMKKNYQVEITPWEKADFDKNLVFPPQFK